MCASGGIHNRSNPHREYMVNSSMLDLMLAQFNHLNLGFKPRIALLSHWVWVEVEGIRDNWICGLEF